MTYCKLAIAINGPSRYVQVQAVIFGKAKGSGGLVAKEAKYPFGAVLSALAALYNAKANAQQATLKARVNHLQRLEVLDVAPGKGRAVEYEIDHIWRWVFCLELAEFGVSPATAAGLVASYWTSPLASIFRSAQRATAKGEADDVYFYVRGSALMSAAWQSSDRFAGAPHIGKFTAKDAGRVLQWLQEDQAHIPPRISIVNLTARLRLLNRSLADSQKLTPVE